MARIGSGPAFLVDAVEHRAVAREDAGGAFR
jgi:hypothetical protein